MKIAFMGMDSLTARILDRLAVDPEVEIAGVAAEPPEDAGQRWPGVLFAPVEEVLAEGLEMILVAEGEPGELRAFPMLPPDCEILPLRQRDPLHEFVSRLLAEEEELGQAGSGGLVGPQEFEQRLETEIVRARRYGINVGFILFAVNDLEDYEERNGRLMRDLALRDVGSIIARNIRLVDTGAILEDNRMAILLPETGRLGTVRLAERIRIVVEEYPFPSRDLKNVERLTVSGGLSAFPSIAESREELMRQATEALETAMREGRNRTKLYNKGA